MLVNRRPVEPARRRSFRSAVWISVKPWPSLTSICISVGCEAREYSSTLTSASASNSRSRSCASGWRCGWYSTARLSCRSVVCNAGLLAAERCPGGGTPRAGRDVSLRCAAPRASKATSQWRRQRPRLELLRRVALYRREWDEWNMLAASRDADERLGGKNVIFEFATKCHKLVCGIPCKLLILWWAQQDSNLRLPPCEGGTLPLSYAPRGSLQKAIKGVRRDCIQRISSTAVPGQNAHLEKAVTSKKSRIRPCQPFTIR